MKKAKIFTIGLAIAAGGLATVSQDVVSQMNSWMSAKNHNRIIQIQNEGGVRDSTDAVEISFYSNSSFMVTSPKGVSMLIDPWRNDPSGAWGLWYRMEFPMIDVDIGMSTHAHFDHDALDRLDANMLLDRMAGTFELGDVKISGIADKHVCVAPGIIPWTDAVKQFEGRDDPCPPTNMRHLDNNLYVIETGGMRLLMWGDNRADPPAEVLEQIGEVDVVFLPVDGSRHILDYEQADKVMQMTGAKVGIPHHYLVPETTFVTSTLMPALEWSQRHPNTILDGPTVELSAASIADMKGHVMYFGSHNMVTADG